MPTSTTDPHDWQLLDAQRGLEVRQRTDGHQPNQWEVRDRLGRTTVLDDTEFDRLRAEDWLPEELR